MHYGLSIPFDGVPLAAHRALFDAAASAGFTDLWSMEVNGNDAFTPLAAAAVSHPQLRLGTAIVPAFTRSPALIAMSAASLADLGPAEVLLGIGASSNVIVENWNGVPFVEPYQRVRDTAVFLRRALSGEKVDLVTKSFTIKGFRLGRVPERRPLVLIAGLRAGMLRLAGRESDGAILNWLSPDDARRVVAHVNGVRSEPAEIVARLFVVASSDVAAVRAHAKRAIAAYLNVPVYAAFHEWLGRGEVLAPMWAAWRAGDRKAALDLIPDSLVDELFIYGTPSECLAQVDDYVAAGITTPMLSITSLDGRSPDELIGEFARA
ncbi:MAG: LLM class F420-dependent oxidoreductase [Ilumatobacteraceae bacterium]